MKVNEDQKLEKNNIFSLNEHSFDLFLISLRNLIGNSYLVKCISHINDQEKLDNQVNIEYTKCFDQMLEELMIANSIDKNPFYYYLVNSISKYHNTHICSTKTATFLTILFYKNLKSVVDNNSLSIKLTVKYLRHVLNECIEIVKKNLIKKIDVKFQNEKFKLVNRHISYNVRQNSEFYKILLNGVSRLQNKIGDVLYDLLLMIDDHNLIFNFENIILSSNTVLSSKKLNNLSLNTLNNEEFNYKILKGLALKIDNIDNLGCVKYHLKNKSESFISNALLFESSLTADFVHLGFNKHLNVNEIITSNINSNHESEYYYDLWIENVKQLLISNKINLIFVRDKIDKNLIDFLKQNFIVHFSNLSFELIKNLKNNFKCSSLIYIEDFKPDKIFKLKICLLNDENSSLKINYLNIQSVNEIEDEIKFTVLFETKLYSLANMYKEYLRHCLKRLHNILKTSCYLNGSGVVEKYVAENLKNNQNKMQQDKDQDEILYYDLITEVYVKTFREYYTLVTYNNENNTSNINCVDDCFSKFEAWKASCMINETFLNSDISLTY